MPLSREPGLGQMSLPDAPRPSISPESLQARNSFSKAVTPEFHGLFIDDYADVTKEQIAYVTPQLLGSSLIGVNREASNSVYYRNPLTRESTWIAVTPMEFKQVGGNITTLGNRVVSHVLNSRPKRSDFGPDRDAAVRGGVHAVTDKLDKLVTYRDKTLHSQVADVKWLAHAAKSPGYAWKKGIDVRICMANVRSFVFGDMLLAMREANGWSPEKSAGIEKVIDYRLFFDRAGNQHIKNWRKMLTLSEEYLGYKQAIYNEKIAKAEQYIRANEAKV